MIDINQKQMGNTLRSIAGQLRETIDADNSRELASTT